MCLKRFKESRSRWIYPAFPEHGNVFYGAWGIASTSRKTIRSTKAEWMVFRICTYRCIACHYYFGFFAPQMFSIGLCFAQQTHPHLRPYMRFLFVRPEFCPLGDLSTPKIQLSSDSTSRRTPLLLASPSRYRADSGLSP